MHDIVVDGKTVFPLQDIGPKAVVRKAFNGVGKGIMSELEVDKVSFGGGTSFGGDDLVRVVQYGSGSVSSV